MTKEKSEALKAGRNLSSTIETNIQNKNVDSKEDASAKKIFSYRIILGVLLKLCVNEYQHCSLKEIVSYIEAVKEGSVEVSPGLAGESVRRGNAESSVGSEKRTYFDIYFNARLPGSNKKRIYLLKIDLEIQKSLNLNYPIENRALYYLAREVSSQLDYVYEDTTAYGGLNKAFTIWLCLNDIPRHLQNTVIKHKMMVSEAYGIEKEETPTVDLMEMVIIRLGGRPNMEKAPEVVKYLYGIFENANYGEYFDKYVTRKDIEKEPGIREELNSMSGIATLNFREGQMEGRKEGRMEGRKEGRIISLYYDADLSVEEIAKKVNCAISDVEAVLNNMDVSEI